MNYLLTGAVAYVALFVFFAILHVVDFLTMEPSEKARLIEKKTTLQNLLAWVFFAVAIHVLVDAWS